MASSAFCFSRTNKDLGKGGDPYLEAAVFLGSGLASGVVRAGAEGVAKKAFSWLGAGAASRLTAEEVGRRRVAQVVSYYGDEVVAQGVKYTAKGLRSGDIDVVLKGRRFIEVGGPAKGSSQAALSQFGRQMQALASHAEEHGGSGMFLYAKGTPAAAIRIAERWLGSENVSRIPQRLPFRVR